MILTNHRGEKFYLNVLVVATISPIKIRGGCEIFLLSGGYVTCIEDFASVIKDFEAARASAASSGFQWADFTK